jgi:hypothetical protein
MVLYVV